MVVSTVLLLISIIAPLVIGFLLFIPFLQKYAGWITAGVSTVVLAFLITASVPIWNSSVTKVELQWAPAAGLLMGFLLDNLSALIALLIAVVSTLTAFYSIKYMEHEERKGLYFSLYNFFFAGMLGVVLSTNLLEFFFFWELMLIPSYLMIVYWGTKAKAAKVALKYFFYTQVGSIGIIVSFAIIAFYGNSLNIAEIATNLSISSLPNAILYLTFILLMIGLAVKLAIFPFQNWLPDAHGEAPTPISVLLSAVMIETAAYAIVRIAMQFYGEIFETSRIVFESVGVFTLLYGGFLALRQTDVKRLLAYSSVSQMGYVFIGLSTYNQFGVSGGLFHILAHGFGKGILFMTAGILIHEVKTRDITAMGGLGRKMPFTAIISFIAALNLAGTPPLSGFFSEWFIFSGAFYQATTEFVILGIFLLLGSILSAAYMLRFLWKVFLGPLPGELEKTKETKLLLWVPGAILALLAIFFGIFANVAIELFSTVI
ncbi:MAG: NADH-quinone oxidoreductase subunit L [Candidatus Heimdallarchaeum aukensis]|uniref:NADH-quinone oxidoreductase subunit L n=1 Tax=Candidatus Heimdallarchaeum aukensis TaxID=2876573 RepID=A0A9Y1FLI1_9ARCH|nr:MAG: NADH-quinone oxidoreductase subunit L [Candidatus Heimdallarchaeum aukensis]